MPSSNSIPPAPPSGPDPAEQDHPTSLLRRLRVSTKLALAFGLLILLVAITAGVAFAGLRKVEHTWQQALHLGAELAHKTEGARACLQEARRHEKEFLLRWPQVGVRLAFRTWVVPNANGAAKGNPVDVHGSVDADMAQFRDTVHWIAKTIEQLQREAGAIVADGAAKAEELERLRTLAIELGNQSRTYVDSLHQVTRLLRERGDIGADAQVDAQRLTLGAPSCHGHLHKMADHQRALELALLATPTAAELAVAEAARPHLLALTKQMVASQHAYARLVDSGLPFALPLNPAELTSPLQAPAVEEEAAASACHPDAQVVAGPDAVALADSATMTARAIRRSALAIDGHWAKGVLAASARVDSAFGLVLQTDDTLRRTLRTFLCRADAIERQLHDFSDSGPKAVAGLARRAEAQAATVSGMVYLISVACLLLGIGLAMWLARDIRLPLQDLAETAREVSNGNLDAKAWVYAQDELGEFATTFNEMTARIAKQNSHIAAQLREIAEEHSRSEQLLLNVLPMVIAERLKGKEHPIADAFDDASVLFADVVGYTALSAKLPPTQVVDCLSKIFTAFDAIAQHRGVEKIKTIGDCYMAACGLPRHVPDHARRMADMALDMLTALHEINKELPTPVQLRIGLNCGPVVAGVIGERKFIYDLWGDTVNVASRMESHGIAGEIQLPTHMYQFIAHTHLAERRGDIEIKGRGTMETWLLRGRLEGWDDHDDEDSDATAA